jgi:hypothetical protein
MSFWKWFRIIGTVVILAVSIAIYFYSDSASTQPATNQETGGTKYYTN